MKKKLSSIAISTAITLALGLTFAITSQAAVVPNVGVACKKLGSTAEVGLITYRCSNVAGKREWAEPWFTGLKKSAKLYRSLPADIKTKGKLTFATDPTDPPFQFYSAANDLVTYFNSSRAFLYRKGTLPNIKTEDDLCGLKVGIPAGTTMATAIVGLSTNCTTAGKSAIAYSLYPDQATTVLAVKSGRADLTILSAHVSSWWQQNGNGEFDVLLRPTQGADYNGMVVRKGSLTIVMQKAIQQLIDDGTFKTIFTKWNIEKLMRSSAEINISTR